MTLTDVPGIRVGHAEVPGGGSGCTVILGPFRGAVEVRGLATGTRELGVLSPFHLVPRVDAVLLTGGSAFGLAAADGVMEWLAEHGQGYETGAALVPLVPAAVIYDLAVEVARPGPIEGRRACQEASRDPVPEGRVGAGVGATVGKILGSAGASPGGVGSVARNLGEGYIGALAVVNALGDVLRPDGTILAGARNASGAHVVSDSVLARRSLAGPTLGDEGPVPGANTTLVVVATDIPLSRLDLGRVARVATGAFSRAISPVNTPFDGDILFALSTGETEGPEPPGLPAETLLRMGVAARQLTEDALRRAVTAGGNPSSPASGASS